MDYLDKNKDGINKELEDLRDEYNLLKKSHLQVISELELAQEALVLSEKKFRQVVENMLDVIWELDLDLTFTYISSGIEKMTGFVPSEIIGKKVFELIEPSMVEPFKELFIKRQENFKKTGELDSSFYELKQLCKNGEYIWIETSSNARFDDDNNLIGFQGITRNITESKNAKRDILLSQERLTKVFNSAPYVIALLRISDQKLIDVNKAAVEFSGFSREEIMNDNSVILSIWQDEDQRAKYYESIKQRECLKEFELKYKTKNGEIGTALMTTEFITIDNELCVLSFFEIITKRKIVEELLEENREKYYGLSYAAFDAIFISENGICLEQNHQAEQMFGYTNTEAIGRYGTDWIVPEDREIVMSNILSGYEEPYRARGLRKDGSTFPAIIRARMMNFKGRKVRVTSMSDVSLQINAEQKLFDSEQQFRLIFENSNDAIFWVETSTGFILKCNKAAEILVERSRNELIGNYFSILHAPEFKQKSIDEFNKHIELKGNTIIESEVITKSGKTKIVEVSSTIVTIEDKEINQAIFKDITDKKRLEEALRNIVVASGLKEKENIFSKLVINLSLAFNVKYALVGQIKENNDQKIETLAACKDGEIIENFEYNLSETPCAEVLSKDFSLFEGNVQQILSNDLLIKQMDVKSYMGMPLKNSNGNVMGIIIIMSDTNLIINNDAESILSLFAFRASSELERKQDEDALLDSWANLLALVENTNDNIWAIDNSYRLVVINGKFDKEFKNAYGVELAVGMNILDTLPKEIRNIWKLHYDRALANERFTFEEHFVFGDVHIYTEVAMNPIVANNKIIGVSVFARDITERKQAEILLQGKNKEIAAQNEEYLQLNEELLKANEELIKAKEKAEESDRLKTSFLQNMSHEIRTPMNAIMGFSSLLADQYNNKPKLEQYSEIISRRCSDLLDIINDILDIAKIESGQLTVNNEEYDLNLLFIELLSFFKENQYWIGKQNLTFNLYPLLNKDANLIVTDSVKLKQIFINLIGNAFKFTECGKIEGACKVENNMLIFNISDTGIGIPSDKKDFIFERFSQIYQSKDKLYGGTGLGLSIVKGLVSLLGGDIWLESELGKGTTFYFSIPYVTAASVKKVQDLPDQKDDFNFDGIKLLIVEDDIYNLEYLNEILDVYGFEIFNAENGKKAVKIALEQELDIVLMDIRLPDFDGYETTRQIKDQKPNLKIIAQTAFAAYDDRARALKNGFDDYISKPVHQELLIELIKKNLKC